MSANKFKVGDKVRVREGLVVDKFYGDMYCYPLMDKIGGEILTVDSVQNIYYGVKENDCYWSDEMLEPVSIKKTLKNMEKGDVVVNKPDYDYPRTVLLAIDGCYLLSAVARPTVASCWRTAEELRVSGCTVQQPTPTKIETIEINGKKYNKADVEEAIKDLEVVD
jgi:hypothetical protein|nr:MAG TPA: Mind bomb SH3 repeat domain [Caudoviricetes sp.]